MSAIQIRSLLGCLLKLPTDFCFYLLQTFAYFSSPVYFSLSKLELNGTFERYNQKLKAR